MNAATVAVWIAGRGTTNRVDSTHSTITTTPRTITHSTLVFTMEGSCSSHSRHHTSSRPDGRNGNVLTSLFHRRRFRDETSSSNLTRDGGDKKDHPNNEYQQQSRSSTMDTDTGTGSTSTSTGNTNTGTTAAGNTCTSTGTGKRRIDRLFRKTTRLRQLYRCHYPAHDAIARRIVEVELVAGNQHALLHNENNYTWQDFCSLFQQQHQPYNSKKTTVVWLSLSTCVVSHYFFGEANIGPYRPIVTLETSDGRKNLQQSFSIWSRSVVQAASTFKILLHLLKSTCSSDHPHPNHQQYRQVRLQCPHQRFHVVRDLTTVIPIAGSILTDFVADYSTSGNRTSSNNCSIQSLVLDSLILEEDHCRLLVTRTARKASTVQSTSNSASCMKITLSHCRPAPNARNAFYCFLQHYPGAIILQKCPIDLGRLSHALAWSTCHITGLTLDSGNHQNSTQHGGIGGGAGLQHQLVARRRDADFTTFCQALSQNTGLLELAAPTDCRDSLKWSALVAAITGHPTLHTLELRNLRALTTSQLLDVEKLLRQNVELRTVRLEYNDSGSGSDSFHPALFYQQVIVPLSEINRFRSASARRPLYAVADGILAVKLLGRAVYSVRHSPTVVQMLLSEYVEIAFQ
jgi:hypothetical protein